MTAFSQTITNSINLSATPDNEWGVWNWGAFLWLEGTEDLETHTFKWLAEDPVTLTDGLSFNVRMLVSETLSFSSDRSSAILFSGIWSYQTTDGVTDWEDQTLTDWADDSVPSTTWAIASPPSTDWS